MQHLHLPSALAAARSGCCSLLQSAAAAGVSRSAACGGGFSGLTQSLAALRQCPAVCPQPWLLRHAAAAACHCQLLDYCAVYYCGYELSEQLLELSMPSLSEVNGTRWQRS